MNFDTLLASVLLVAAPLFSATPVETHGALTVSGSKIIGSRDNQKVQLAGMSLYWSIWGGEKFYNPQVVDWLVQDWNITLIRIAMGVEPNDELGKGYLSNPTGQKTLVKTVVDAAIANGIYVIIDWHDNNANKNVDQAKSFFREMAQTYSVYPNVIWEIWNEPDNSGGTGTNGADTWDDIKEYANQVIPVIRQYSSNLILVGTPNRSQGVDIAASSPISGTNIAYTLHFYAGSHGSWLRAKAETAMSLGAALFITEFGLSIDDGGITEKAVFTDATKIWLDWADQKSLSWANWSVADKYESSAALLPGASVSGNWNSGNLSQSGQWIRNRLRLRPLYEIDTLEIPGQLEAEDFFSMSKGMQIEMTTDSGGGKNLCYSKSGSWSEYNIRVHQTGLFTVEARAATQSQGGTLTLKVNGTAMASWNIETTGGWQSWTTTDLSPIFRLPSGPAIVRMEWSGSDTNLVNLNWLRFQPGSSIINKASSYPSFSIGPLSTRPGSVTFDISSDIKKLTLFTLSGHLLFSTPTRPGKIELPIGKGLQILNLENRSGESISLPVMGF